MKWRYAVAGAALALAAVAAAWTWHARLEPGASEALRSHAVDPAALGGDFTLTDHDGNTRGLAEFRGRVVLLTFGYANCPDVCPMTLGEFATAKRGLGEDAERMAGLFVSVDPERDDPARLRGFVQLFDPAFVGMTGTREQIDAVVRQYGGQYRITPGKDGGETEVGHTTYTYLIDGQGRVRYLMPFGTRAGVIEEGVRALLRELS